MTVEALHSTDQSGAAASSSTSRVHRGLDDDMQDDTVGRDGSTVALDHDLDLDGMD